MQDLCEWCTFKPSNIQRRSVAQMISIAWLDCQCVPSGSDSGPHVNPQMSACFSHHLWLLLPAWQFTKAPVVRRKFQSIEMPPSPPPDSAESHVYQGK
eukprot:s954_g9.t1